MIIDLNDPELITKGPVIVPCSIHKPKDLKPLSGYVPDGLKYYYCPKCYQVLLVPIIFMEELSCENPSDSSCTE